MFHPFPRMGKKVYTRKPFEVTNFNGCLFSQSYWESVKLLKIILSYVEPKDLVFNCRRVCKTWCNVIDVFVLKLKCEKDNYDVKNKDLPWFACYWILGKKNLWNQNLIENGCGEYGLRHWNILTREESWKVEEPPSKCEKFPLDIDLKIGLYNSCFTTLSELNIKEQRIDLAAQGATPELMDILQPDIIISEWYYSHLKENIFIRLNVKLCDKYDDPIVSKLLDHKIIHRRGSFHGSDWRKAIHIFRNYGPGVRFIYFQNSCRVQPFEKGHRSIKLTGASVVLKIQKEIKKKDEKLFNRNLIKNGCGQEKLKHWTLFKENDGCELQICQYESFPLHIDDEVKLHKCYFETQVFGNCDKKQIVDLITEGATPHLMDFVKPNILVSDWCTGTDFNYRLHISLCDKHMRTLDFEILTFKSKTTNCCLQLDKDQDWQKVSHIFRNYKPGVRYVVFRHSVENLETLTYKSKCGRIKMTGASVVIQNPETSMGPASSEEFLFWEGY